MEHRFSEFALIIMLAVAPALFGAMHASAAPAGPQPLAGVSLRDIRTGDRSRLAWFDANGVARRHSRVFILDSTFSRLVFTTKQRPDTVAGEIRLGAPGAGLQDLCYCDGLDRFFALEPQLKTNACSAFTFRIRPAAEQGIALDPMSTGTVRFELPAELLQASVEGLAVNPEGSSFWLAVRNLSTLETWLLWYTVDPTDLKRVYHRDVIQAVRNKAYTLAVPKELMVTGLGWHQEGLYICACNERSETSFRANALLLWRWQDERLFPVLPAFAAGNRVSGVVLDHEAVYLVFGNRTADPSRIAVAPLALVAIDNALRTQRVQDSGKIK